MVKQNLTLFKSDVNDLNDTPLVITTDVSGLLADGWVADIKGQLDDLNSTPVDIEANVEGDAETNLPALRESIESLPAITDIEVNEDGNAETK